MNKTLCFLAVLLFAVPLTLAQGTYTQIDYPNATQTILYGVNTAGDVVGSYILSGVIHGFLLSGGTYTTIDFQSPSTVLYGINDLGQVVGQSSSGFLYDLQTQMFTKIAYPGASGLTVPTCINNSGAIGGHYFNNAQLGFELMASTYTQVAPFGRKTTYVVGISASDKLVGTVLSKHTNMFVNFSYSQQYYRKLLVPNLPQATVTGINPAGDVLLGIYVPSSGVVAGFVSQNQNVQSVQFPGSSITFAEGVNDSGEVVGYFYGSTNIHGFMWTPPTSEHGEKK